MKKIIRQADRATCEKHPAGDGEHTCTRCLRPVDCAEYFANNHQHERCARDRAFPHSSSPHHESFRPIDQPESA